MQGIASFFCNECTKAALYIFYNVFTEKKRIIYCSVVKYCTFLIFSLKSLWHVCKCVLVFLHYERFRVPLTQLPPMCQSPSEGFLERGGEGLNGAAVCLWSSPLRDLFPQNPNKDLDGMETDLPIVVFLFWLRNLSSKHELCPFHLLSKCGREKGEGKIGR